MSVEEMCSMSGNWRASIQEKIRTSEETLRRVCEQQSSHNAARKAAFASTFGASPKVLPDVPPSLPASSSQLEDKVHCLQSQVRNCLTELETEKAVRCDCIQDARQRIEISVGELKAMFQQLRKENQYLTDTVQMLEKRLISNSSPVPSGRASISMDARSGSIPYGATAAISSDLVKRVEELESTVTRQRRMIEDRQTRLDGVLREMVNVKINTEVERMRSVARDAARESVEDLVRLRLTAMQEMFNDELQRVMRSSGVSSEVAQTTERLFRQMEHDVQRRVQELSSAVNVVSGGVRQHEAALAAMEDRVMEKVAAMGRELGAARREMRDEAAKGAQASDARAAATQLATESAVGALVAAACEGVARKEDVATAVAESHDRLERQCTAISDRLAAAKRAQDVAAAEHRKRAEELEERLGGLQDAAEEIRQQIAHVNQFVTGAKTEMEQWKLRMRDALTASEEARALAQESAACAQRTEDATREGFSRSGVELQRLAQEQTAASTQIRQLSEKMTAAEARQASVQVTVNELSERMTNTLPPLSAKLGSVQRTLQDVCMPKTEELAQSTRELQALCEQLQANVSSTTKTDARQFSDIRRELCTGMQAVEDRVLQAMHEWQQESSMTVGGVKTIVDGIRTTVKTHEKLFARKDAMDAMEEGIAERLLLVEGKLDTALVKVGKKEQTPAPAPVSVSRMTSEVQEDMERQLGELRNSIDAVRQNAVRQWSDMQKHMDTKMQDDVERVTQTLHRMRDENSLQMQKLRAQLSEEAEDRCRRVEEAAKSDVHHLQTRMESLRDALEPKRLVFAVCDDEELRDELAGAMQGVFALRSDTANFMARVKEKFHQFEQRIDELHAVLGTREREIERRLQACELAQGSHAEYLASLESQLGTVSKSNEGWRDESHRDCKKEMDLLLAHFDECVDAVRGAAAEAELQTRTMQFGLQKIREEQTALRKEVALSQAAQQASAMAVDPHSDRDQDSGEKEDDPDHVAWKAQVEERIGVLEAKTDATANSTADALDSLHEGIERCVSVFVQKATSAALLADPAADGEEVTGLDGVLLFLLGQLCRLDSTVQTLHGGALGTLDLVQHHEEQLALLPPLQSFAVRCADHVAKIAEVVGVHADVSVGPPLRAHRERGAGDGGGAANVAADPAATVS